jgi:energy-coupling factor transport system ATP-binding protein
MAELAARNIRFSYRDCPPLFDDISFSVCSGETVVLIGGNACGKTTLLRILAGMLQPAAGEVRLNGELVAQLRSRVGLIFQNPDHQMIAATVEEEIALGLELRGTPQTVMRQLVGETLHKFDLEEIKTCSPERLSGGQKQRVALAAIMAMRPDFLLLDEPDSYLDAPSRRNLMQAVELVRTDTGIVWTTSHPRRHPPADRFLFLVDGKVQVLEDAERQTRFAADTRL